MITDSMAGIHSSPVLQPAEADAHPGKKRECMVGSANCCNEVESSLQKLKSEVRESIDVVALQ